MALRIRKDGRILCAAMHPQEPGDTYIDDGLHYQMSVVHKVICSEESDMHEKTGQWWWVGNIPDGVTVDQFYISEPCCICGGDGIVEADKSTTDGDITQVEIQCGRCCGTGVEPKKRK